MNKIIFDKKHYTEQIKDFPIWKLINLSNVLTNRLIQIKKQGNKDDKKKIKRMMYKRGIVYNILLDKLLLWKHNGSNNNLDISELHKLDMEMLELSA